MAISASASGICLDMCLPYLICNALVPNIRALSYFVMYGVVIRSLFSLPGPPGGASPECTIPFACCCSPFASSPSPCCSSSSPSTPGDADSLFRYRSSSCPDYVDVSITHAAAVVSQLLTLLDIRDQRRRRFFQIEQTRYIGSAETSQHDFG